MAFKWFDERLEGDNLDYALLGVARLMGHPKGEDWEERPRRDELDRQVWTFHRVWIDRYGCGPTMRQGKERRDYWERRSRGEAGSDSLLRRCLSLGVPSAADGLGARRHRSIHLGAITMTTRTRQTASFPAKGPTTRVPRAELTTQGE